jgi:hypothetical protein
MSLIKFLIVPGILPGTIKITPWLAEDTQQPRRVVFGGTPATAEEMYYYRVLVCL